MGEWGSGGVGEWGNEGVGEWGSGGVGETINYELLMMNEKFSTFNIPTPPLKSFQEHSLSLTMPGDFRQNLAVIYSILILDGKI